MCYQSYRPTVTSGQEVTVTRSPFGFHGETGKTIVTPTLLREKWLFYTSYRNTSAQTPTKTWSMNRLDHNIQRRVRHVSFQLLIIVYNYDVQPKRDITKISPVHAYEYT